uniref:Pectinesterase inhibitor domain-containing protein n=1 Tax=Nicotiana tabacum TaxID=4097 RepID=A0A1S4CSQ1_TOBAC|nr:PREDICTED: uncharacterized protein LOC107822070 [Nicotiana tabacum]
MSSLINVSVLAIFLLAFFSATSEPDSPKLLDKACAWGSTDWNSSFCLDVLKSSPLIISAEDLLQLTLSIIETGLINATRTQIYIGEKLKGNIQVIGLELKSGLGQCLNLYGQIIGLYKSALVHVEKHKLYDVASFEFSIAANNAEYCQGWLLLSGILDADISSGNKFIKYLSLTGYTVVNDLMISDWLIKK